MSLRWNPRGPSVEDSFGMTRWVVSTASFAQGAQDAKARSKLVGNDKHASGGLFPLNEIEVPEGRPNS